MRVYCVVLAGGLSKRMLSEKSKVLHMISGRPMIRWCVQACKAVNPDQIVVVANVHNYDDLKQIFQNDREVVVALQESPRGTGDAMRFAMDYIYPGSAVYVAGGDAPLIRPSTVKRMFSHFRETHADALVLTAEIPDPTGYGRVLREGDRLIRIVEEKDASETEKRIKEVNGGFYFFKYSALEDNLHKLSTDNAQKEYYLTDVLSFLDEVVIFKTDDWEEILGVNTRKQLALVEQVMQRRIKDGWMERGVTFVLPDTSYVEADVEIGRDTVIYPGVSLLGRTKVGKGCIIGPNVTLRDAEVPDGSRIT